MSIALPQPWPADAAGALALEARLRGRLDLVGPGPPSGGVVVGLDAAYAARAGAVAGAAVAWDAATGEVVASATGVGQVAFPYVRGLLAVRELPALVDAWNALTLPSPPGLVLCDGHGLAHPRRFGLACWVGVLTGLPTVGVAKTPFVGAHGEPGPVRGATAPIRDGVEEDRPTLHRRARDGRERVAGLGNGAPAAVSGRSPRSASSR